MRRLRKVLSLSNSSEPGEAAAALHQARIIMDKYGLDAVDVETSSVEEASVRLSGSDVPRWELILVTSIKRALGVEALIQSTQKVARLVRPRASVIFVAEGKKAQIASYAFEVLRRQLKASMGTTFETLAHRAGPDVTASDIRKFLKKGQRDAYAHSWSAAVFNKIQALATPPSPVVQRYMENKKLPEYEIKKSRHKNGQSDTLSAYLAAEGFRAGNEAQLHQAMHTNGSQVLSVECDERG
jgi:hypothetical protein